ncbi:MAG: recombination regulator RecX [Neisseria sp.]|uniref:recombination regulator RecX n=1 Tax=Neisseria sp. TaxID=192066 RepID=UPI0026DCB486|nr:recombination regulator RecX [Neisseria sp.]MDO4640399.1 recombination regulator RecX [Neisseria sp.]
MKTPKSLRARALDILARREVSRSELKRKLAPYAESEEEVERVLAEFAERNWQSDQRFTEAFIHSKSRRYGTLRLKHALAEKGIDPETARASLPSQTQECATAQAVLLKKFKRPAADLSEKQKQMRFLAYRGFDMDTINRAMKTAWQKEEN